MNVHAILIDIARKVAPLLKTGLKQRIAGLEFRPFGRMGAQITNDVMNIGRRQVIFNQIQAEACVKDLACLEEDHVSGTHAELLARQLLEAVVPFDGPPADRLLMLTARCRQDYREHARHMFLCDGDIELRVTVVFDIDEGTHHLYADVLCGWCPVEEFLEESPVPGA